MPAVEEDDIFTPAIHSHFRNGAGSFNGIFANASLFHVPSSQLARVLRDLAAALKPDGVLFSGTLLDYRLPCADDLMPFVLSRESFACRNNPLGVNGCGEAGAIAAPPAVMNAVMNALPEAGISNIDMPATPVQIWSAIRATGDRQ